MRYVAVTWTRSLPSRTTWGSRGHFCGFRRSIPWNLSAKFHGIRSAQEGRVLPHTPREGLGDVTRGSRGHFCGFRRSIPWNLSAEFHGIRVRANFRRIRCVDVVELRPVVSLQDCRRPVACHHPIRRQSNRGRTPVSSNFIESDSSNFIESDKVTSVLIYAAHAWFAAASDARRRAFGCSLAPLMSRVEGSPGIRIPSRKVTSHHSRRAACCSFHEQLHRHVSAYDQYTFWLQPIHILVTTNTRSGYNQYAVWLRPIRVLVTTNTHDVYTRYGSYHSARAHATRSRSCLRHHLTDASISGTRSSKHDALSTRPCFEGSLLGARVGQAPPGSHEMFLRSDVQLRRQPRRLSLLRVQ